MLRGGTSLLRPGTHLGRAWHTFSCWQLILGTINFQLPTGSLDVPDWLWCSAVEGDAGDEQLLPSLMHWLLLLLLLLQRNHLWHFPKFAQQVLPTGTAHPCCSSAWIWESFPAAPGSALAEGSLLFSASSADARLYSYTSQAAFGKGCPPLQCQLTAGTSNHQFH